MVLPKLGNDIFTTTSFDLWMSKCAHDMLFLLLLLTFWDFIGSPNK
jgi:hypothetical protein